jgi:serine phosphatase RsbU (regulator of sigma subunit)
MGHGIAAALDTMHLSQLRDRFHRLVVRPAECTQRLNKKLVKVVTSDRSFATAACCLVDLERGALRFWGTGGPQVLLTHRGGGHASLKHSGFPLAVMEDATYAEPCVALQGGDSLLLFSDGAIEIASGAGKTLWPRRPDRHVGEAGPSGNGHRHGRA